MIRSAILVTAVLAAASGAFLARHRSAADQGKPPTPATAPPALQQPAPRPMPERVQVAGTLFRRADGTAFEWRGITAFRLLEFVASGKEAEAAAYLDWAAKNQVTVVRVLVMAKHLFPLAPADGLRALPRLLTLAAERGVYVEVVALADTAAYAIDLDAHVKAAGAIAAAHTNAFLELANEPFHQTQHPSLNDRETLARLAALVPEEVVLAYGADAPESSGGGDYVTVHVSRGEGPWGHVLGLAAGRKWVTLYGRPVVSDEPIGAAATRQPGRRDNSPERFRAAAVLTRMSGMHATFHYEGGLHARIPAGVENACFQAWREAWTLLPRGIEGGAFSQLEPSKGALFRTELGDRTWVLGVAGATLPAGVKPVVTGRESALGFTLLQSFF
ncbi:MAG: hypothetical protein WD690_18155 [Vicinamibacterales bacterium]